MQHQTILEVWKFPNLFLIMQMQMKIVLIGSLIDSRSSPNGSSLILAHL